MKNIEATPGQHIDDYAALLVHHAPATGDFNGIRLRARYATTCPGDLSAHFSRKMAERGVIWRNSPEGKRVTAEQEAKRVAAQATVNAGMVALWSLNFTDLGAVLAWVEMMSDPCDRVGVSVPKGEILSTFTAEGWEPGVNCGDDFNGDDARNFAGWIVGQWLSCWYPLVRKFVADWRAKFGGAAS